MVDNFTCNSCGDTTDTGYFYCEKCHRKHKGVRNDGAKEKENNNVISNTGPDMPDVSNQKRQALQDDISEANTVPKGR